MRQSIWYMVFISIFVSISLFMFHGICTSKHGSMNLQLVFWRQQLKYFGSMTVDVAFSIDMFDKVVLLLNSFWKWVFSLAIETLIKCIGVWVEGLFFHLLFGICYTCFIVPRIHGGFSTFGKYNILWTHLELVFIILWILQDFFLLSVW